MNIDIFVEQWMGPESLDYYYIDWVVKEVKRLREEMRRLYDAWFDDEGMSQDAHETLMTELFVELMG